MSAATGKHLIIDEIRKLVYFIQVFRNGEVLFPHFIKTAAEGWFKKLTGVMRSRIFSDLYFSALKKRI